MRKPWVYTCAESGGFGSLCSNPVAYWREMIRQAVAFHEFVEPRGSKSMKFKLNVANRDTGEVAVLILDGSSAEDVTNQANVRGFLVSEVQQVVGSDETQSTVPPLDYHSSKTPKGASSTNKKSQDMMFFLGLSILLIVGGFALAIYCAQIPCVGILGVLAGIFLVILGACFLLSANDISLGVSPALQRKTPVSRYNSAMICPHCQSKGTVKTEQVKQKKGVSGSKATAAVLTGGFSILATGLSRKETMTKAYCAKCSNIWYF